MSSYSFFHTVSCNKPEAIFFDGRWLKVVGIQKHQGVPVVDVLVRREGSFFCKSVFLHLLARTEVLPGIFVTVAEAGKPSKIRLRIEVDQGVAVAFGSTDKKPKQRVFVPIGQIPWFVNHPLTRNFV